MKPPEKPQPTLGSLEALLASDGQAAAPVERWNPPYCGDIGLAILADGTWLYRGSAIGRVELVRLFARVLRRDADGRHYLVTPAEMVDVAVDDAPFVAVEMEVRGRGREQDLLFRTNVDDVVRCDREHPLRFAGPGEGGKPYLLVRGRLEARLTRPVYYELMELVVTESLDGAERSGVWSGGAFFPLG